MQFLNFDHLKFRYEPFPIGIAAPVVAEDVYQEMLDGFPTQEQFFDYRDVSKPGVKMVLSEKENSKPYMAFVRSNPLWWDFYRWIKSQDFIYSILDVLRQHNIDLGLRRISSAERLYKTFKILTGIDNKSPMPRLTSRFEFSALPADGGRVIPHTDASTKIVTLIVSMTREGEWDPDFGGGTDVNRPRCERLMFNGVNRLADFADMEVLHTYEFRPNQAVVFVKTFNSWHSVRPMSAHGSKLLRKTLTINIEAP